MITLIPIESNIQRLPAEVVNLIAAGEVIDSLAAVVRELVENALDAGANRIVISVWPELWRVRVADNGSGMELVDLQQAAIAHTTSKIRNSEDLWKITSLGFRGEALHSLAQLANLEIFSRRSHSKEGWKITYNSIGEILHTETVAIAPGTIVNVSNLFKNWNIRRQGLPTTSQQLRLVQNTIYQIALCYPNVTWQVQQNDKEWFSISPGITAKYILPQILREVHLNDLEYLKLEVPTPLGSGEENYTKLSEIQVILGLPDRCHRRRADWVKVAVNGRIVKTSELEQTIISAFTRTLPRDRYPICFLHLQIYPNQIDWNRHPAKAEIYLHNMNYWQENITAAIGQILRLNMEESPLTERANRLLKASEDKGAYNVSRSLENPAQKIDKISQFSLKAIAQVRKTYILAEHPNGMWLIEQHIAHERVLYEKILDNWQLLPLETPIILPHLSSPQIQQLQRIGIDIEPFGEQLWAARQAPALLRERSDCAEALLELSLGGDLEAARVATACRSAIRNGTDLNLQEMQNLLDQWQQTRNPRTCPHGRPIYLSLEESHLARFFRRHWVIGKSHGI